MRENMRLYATLAIWFAFMVMTTAIFVASDVVSSSDPNTSVFIALILALAASISTIAVWGSGAVGGSQNTTNASANQAKRKRIDSDRLERLVDGLDEDALDELESLLLAREERDAARHDQQL